MVQVANYFDTQVQLLISHGHSWKAHNLSLQADIMSSSQMSDEQKVNWYRKILNDVRLWYCKLQHFARCILRHWAISFQLTVYISGPLPKNSATLWSTILKACHWAALIASDHFLVYTRTYEEEETYIITSGVLPDCADVNRCMQMGIAVCRQESLHADRNRCVQMGFAVCRWDSLCADRNRCVWTGFAACY